MPLEIYPEGGYETSERKPLLIIPALIWLGGIIGLGMLLVGLSGCATTEEEVWQRVCYEQFMGKSERGLMVVRHFCVKEEALK